MNPSARAILPVPRMDRLPHVRVPKPSPLPILPTEAELARAEKRLDQTERREQQTMPPPGRRRKRQDLQGIKREIRKLERAIANDQMSERNMYNAVMNLHLLKRGLAKQRTLHAAMCRRVVARFLNA